MNGNQQKVGLALSGGGARGLAHVGVLKALLAAGIQPCCIAGTSIGAVVGALYAVGHDVPALETEALQLASMSKLIRFIDWLPSWHGLMDGKAIYNHLNRLLGPGTTFADLRLPLGVTATDLTSGQAIDITSGPVIDAVRASLSLLGLFKPVRRNQQRLVDGGFLNHLPVDLARDLGAELVIAVDVQGCVVEEPPLRSTKPTRRGRTNMTPPMLQDMMQINTLMVREITRLRLEQARPELLITPRLDEAVGTIGGLDQIEAIIQQGYEATQAALPQLWQQVDRTEPSTESSRTRNTADGHSRYSGDLADPSQRGRGLPAGQAALL
ncbi:MAG TPA: patatin-like phospholipase family protein [Caldilineaceae bacterium]|nr:patatin-like phospholipase family protein [Caldilineaceae bacterium]